MAGKDLKDAAERLKRRKEILKQAVPMRPDAPENIHLSKAQFIEKRRKEKEEEIAVAKYREDYRKTKEVKSAEEKEVKKESVLEPKKRGRPKRVE